MAISLTQKLKIKAGALLYTINAPKEFGEKLQPLPDGAAVTFSKRNYDQLHWFVTNKAELEKQLPKVLSMLKPYVTCWIYYPKGSSKIETDLTRDKGWEALLAHDELQWLSLISFDDTWSAFAMRLKNDADVKAAEKPKERAVFDYIDAATKTIRLPEDLAKAMDENKNEKAFFDTLSFTNRKEYVEWIVTAKREETRTQRVKDAVEKLRNKFKNPADR